MRIAVIVNDTAGGPIAARARQIYLPLAQHHTVEVRYRETSRLAATLAFARCVREFRPDLACVLNTGYPGVIAGVLGRSLLGTRLLVDTGDVSRNLLRSAGANPISCELAGAVEYSALHRADIIVVRGTKHKEHLHHRVKAPVHWVPDGVDTSVFHPFDAADQRRKLGIAPDQVAVCALGSIIWSAKTRSCFGWDLVEAMQFLSDVRAVGVIIGDGSGLPALKKRSEELGLLDRIIFTNRVPYQELPEYLNAMDICISTQTNDLVGQVRTTGKLPLYLACGKYVLASDVGEASLILPADMRIPFHGSHDNQYPPRLAERIRALIGSGAFRGQDRSMAEIARTRFDASMLADRMRGIVDSCGA